MLFHKAVLILFLARAVSCTSATFTRRDCGSEHSDPIVFSELELAYKAEVFGNENNNVSAATAALTNLVAPNPIKVYYHGMAVNKTRRGGWLSDADIDVQITILNFAYNSSGLTFALANTAREINEKWYKNGMSEDDMKLAKRVGGARDLNVYSVGCFTSTIGTATYPEVYAKYPKTDGVVLCHETMPGGTAQHYNTGKNAVHETGHWVGLLHTFEGGCDGTGDGVDDTPPEKIQADGCPYGRDTCPGGGPDPIHNFMDYTYDECMNEFTPGQVLRMRGQLAKFRGIPA